MIKKLRRRFMAVMMCIFTLIVCAIVSGIYMLMKNSEMRQADFILDRAVETEFKDGHHSPDFPDNMPKPVPPSDEPSPEKDTRSMFDKIQDSTVSENNMMRGRIMISADSDGNITYEKYLFTEEFSDSEKALLEAAVSDIVQSGQSRGNVTVSDVEYRFMSVPSDSGKNIVLLDRSIELFMLRRLLLISAGIASVSLAVLFVISFFLAKWAAEPVRRAWENQKEFFANASLAFDNKREDNLREKLAEERKEKSEYAKKVGQLTMQVDWLKKKSEEVIGPDYESKFSPKPFDD